MLREERNDLVFLLNTLLEQQKASHKPDMYCLAIKQTRRKILGMYRQVDNARIHQATHPNNLDSTPTEQVLVS
jgi:hypothetical protein